ncbi:Beta-glucosidase/6-phospho-beta-glucosidase/beta-galactosidase [Dyadobacter soli]|uniref:Beta-glucosidase/6-phospho-beta-glucosidase/beta-galactosidase n=1 Tax=Dyadobacter soli TaxID=659014 RepID=A0A1G7VIC2_9BACT|nr:amine oxidase [Dyadobacter soli]SDG58680.1 Beta-glucosidase/6-phospho-beta-glucosidase/beta-galactosidase [Dyadobacter soli]
MDTTFNTFWMAGFESADLLNSSGDRIDMLRITGHEELVREDYARVCSVGIRTVREGIRWSVVEFLPYRYNFDTVLNMLNAAKEYGVQQIWDICHFGYPSDLSPLHPHFTSRFVALCEAFVNFCLLHRPMRILYVTPINEVSFLSWLGGEVGSTAPYCIKNGWEVKYALMRAYIAGAKAMKQISDLVRIVTTEPLVNMVPELDTGLDDLALAATENELQFQSVDMLCGRICPELGGSEDLPDILGFNYYYNNQWIIGKFQFLGWNDPIPDPRWRPLAELLENAWRRYDRPIILSETSHPKEDRPVWIAMVAAECAKLIDREVPLLGVCLYPIIDRPDWDQPDIWHQSGLWDEGFNGRHRRVLHFPSAMALSAGQQLIARHLGRKHQTQD